MRIIVIGGGVMGASVTWYLARLGTGVSLIDGDLSSARGVTAASYGWVGTGDHLPADDPSGFALRLRAVSEFARLERELGPLPVAARGALGWRWTEAETGALIEQQRAAGARVQRLGRAAIAEHEPRLARPPALAAWAPDDFAVEAGTLARQLTGGAAAMGATLVEQTVEGIETANGHVVGVTTRAGLVPADIVVLANGTGAGPLAAQVGVDLPLCASPAVLVRLAAASGSVRHLLHGSGIEVRPTLGGGLVSAAAYPPDGEEGLPALADRIAAAIADLIGLPTAPAVLSVTAAHRPMTRDGAPLCGFVEGVEGLYVLVAHPGVVLAPLLGHLAADAIGSG